VVFKTYNLYIVTEIISRGEDKDKLNQYYNKLVEELKDKAKEIYDTLSEKDKRLACDIKAIIDYRLNY
jgi:hypothetical protein